MDGKPTFILGVGAQKAGTRFLYTAINAVEGVKLSHPKEMHVFDARFLPSVSGHFHERRKRDLQSLLERRHSAAPSQRHERTRHALRHVLMHYDLSAYVDYFSELAESAEVVGEITPAYSMLSREHFQAIRELLEPHFNLRVIFMLREPVDRIFSAMRMDDRNLERGERPVISQAHERFRDECRSEPHERRTRYDRTITALEGAFDMDDIFYGFYENMFNPGFMHRLAGFLGLKAIPADTSMRVNASPTSQGISAAEVDAALKHYEPVYRFVERKFGKELVSELWDSSRELLVADPRGGLHQRAGQS